MPPWAEVTPAVKKEIEDYVLDMVSLNLCKQGHSCWPLAESILKRFCPSDMLSHSEEDATASCQRLRVLWL